MIGSKELTQRAENTRSPREIYKVFQLDEIEQTFSQTIKDIYSNLGQVDNSNRLTKIQIDEFYRYQIVLLESSFDYFCHSIIKYGFIKIFREEWLSTKNYEDFDVKFSQLKYAIRNEIDENWILKMVDEKISYKTYMGYKNLDRGFNCICYGLIGKIAEKIYGNDESESRKKLKLDLSKIYDRRNQIAHQNDRENITGKKNKIFKSDVLDYINIITDFVKAALETIREIPNNESK